jgi:hypothetical protein
MQDSRLLELDIGQWAWEFLRRNPDYQADYGEFIAIWEELEAAYGAPPHRDFFRWKQDPRASRPAWDPNQITGAACTTDDEDRQLIECWMGAKWGFYQFPQNPALAAWALQTPINWRPAPAHRLHRPVTGDTDAQLVFDLTLPLSAQLDAAKQWLISKQAGLRRQGRPAPRSLQNQQAHWITLLSALDAQSGDLLEEARKMTTHGYREILHLQPSAKTA